MEAMTLASKRRKPLSLRGLFGAFVFVLFLIPVIVLMGARAKCETTSAGSRAALTLFGHVRILDIGGRHGVRGCLACRSSSRLDGRWMPRNDRRRILGVEDLAPINTLTCAPAEGV
jgi:hypothetical protein